MAQDLIALAVLTEDLGSIPSTHLRWLTTDYNSSSGGPNTLF